MDHGDTVALLGAERRLRKLISVLAGVIAATVAMVIPTIFFLTAYLYESERLAIEAELDAMNLSRRIFSNPELWKFEFHRLEEILLSKSSGSVAENHSIFDLQGKVIAIIGDVPPGPVVRAESFLSDGVQMVGRVGLATSLWPVLIRTGWAALVSIGLAVATWVVLRALPLRIVDRTLARLANAQNALDARVADLSVANERLRTEITEREEAQAQLIQASKLATLGEMASGIAHELNQPLTAVGVVAENSLLSIEEDGCDKEFPRLKLETIVKQIDRMGGIINHMRQFSRKDNSSLEWFDPLEAITGAVGLIGEQFRAVGVELEQDLPATCRNLSGHPMRLEQVVLNLLTNARDAALGKSDSAESVNRDPAPTVRVSLVDDMVGNTVVISVADNGGGIPGSAFGRVFDPFFTTKSEGEGTGLGLSISYSIVDAMGGRIEAKNTDAGAMFRITLPVSADQPATVDSPSKRKRAKPGPGKSAFTLPRVIFVDDETDIVEEVAEYLVYEGYDVATAGNGWEALKLHRSRPADMVITDWLMPGMGGDELVRRLRRSHPDLPIMVITGHTTFGEDQDIVAHGASVILKKPIDLHELSQHMRQMVGQ